ncbi:hypothetical protein KY345_04405 [Candidatus Woesearchaeota archaeon]|nr:hypothetical protein [Candidatus Woesearchaeota archaeon]
MSAEDIERERFELEKRKFEEERATRREEKEAARAEKETAEAKEEEAKRKEKFEASFFGRLVGKAKAAPGQAAGSAVQHAQQTAKSGIPLMFLILGIVFHAFHYMQNQWKDLSIGLLAGTAAICIIVIIISNISNFKQEGVKNLIYVGIAVGFEVLYYTLLTGTLETIPWQISKMLGWNGFIIASGFAGFNKEKTYFKFIIYYFLILLMLILLNPLVTALGEGFGWIKTTEVEGATKEDVIAGLQETGATWLDQIGCATSPDPDSCVEEKKWERRRDKTPELVEAMKELCRNDDPDCDCDAFLPGAEKDECEKRQAEIRAEREIIGGVKEKTPMEIEFELPKERPIMSYGTRVGLDGNLRILTPYKPVQISLECKISNKTGEISSTINNQESPLVFPPIQTEETAQSRRFFCQSSEAVENGDYKFNLTASVNNIKTDAYFIGLYAAPSAIKAGGEQFDDLLESAMQDAYGGKEVKSFSDPDLTLLNFVVVPDVSLVEGNKVSALSIQADPVTGENYRFFTLEVSLENKRADSKIKSVDSVEFKIPKIFDLAPSCGQTYRVKGSDDRFTIIETRDGILDGISFERVRKGAKPTRIRALDCYLMANSDLRSIGVNSLRFEGSMQYSQDINEVETVKQVG